MFVLLALALSAAPAGSAPQAVTAALELERQGDDRAAVTALEQLLTTDPWCGLCRLEAARLCLKLGDAVNRARLHAEVARAFGPENPRTHFVWAMAEDEAGQADAAIKALEVSLALRPDYSEARFRLAGLLSSAGRWPQALQEWQRYTKDFPAATGARLQLADALSNTGQAKAAEAELRKLLKIDASRVPATRRLIELLERTGRQQEASRLAAALSPARALRPLRPSAR